MWVRAEIARAPSLGTTHNNCARIRLINGDRQKWIALVVTKSDIESWMVLLDQRMLKDQRFDFIAYLNPLNRLCCLHHRSCSRVELGRILEIIRQSLPKIRCLANIDDASKIILELVRTRRDGNGTRRRSLYRHRYFFDLAGVFAGAAFFVATDFLAADFIGAFFAAVLFPAVSTGTGKPSNGAR